MTLKATKQHLTQLLADPDNKVLALSGKWGTGKSYLWDEIKKGSQDEKIKASLYISLFGLATMDQVKLKVIQSAIPAPESNPTLWQAIKSTIKAQASTYIPHFGSATDHFIEACRNISADPDCGRLGDLIKLLFKDANLEAELAPEHSVSPIHPG